jgi:2-oxoglutarate ferredoxin oxidoreductase subunit delta
MPKITVDRDRCKGCETCVNACPQQILAMSKEINVKGYFYAGAVQPARCIGCRICAIVCPDAAIEVMANGVQYHLFQY